tara:strand:+ start:221 stop:556 length:336 start_codon:yes stop_codon:yes gene_type:complete
MYDKWINELKADKIIKVGLIKGRHELPVDEYIWDKVEEGSLSEILPTAKNHALQWLNSKEFTELHLYPTGFGGYMTAFHWAWNNYKNKSGKKLIIHDHDKTTETYYGTTIE